MPRLDHDGPVPRYLQVKYWLEAQIDSGRYRPHRRVPAERDLSDRFGVSRMTVRQALTELVHEGRLYSRVGSGTFVADPVIRQAIDASAAPDATGTIAGRSGETRVLGCEVALPSSSVAGILRLRAGGKATALRRLHLVEEQPLMIETSWLALRDVDRLDRETLALPIHALLRAVAGTEPIPPEQEVRARRARPEEVGLLTMDAETAVLEVTRHTLGASGAVLEYGISVYRGDRYHILVRPSDGRGDRPTDDDRRDG